MEMTNSNLNGSNELTTDGLTKPYLLLAYLRLDTGMIIIDHCHSCSYNQFAAKENVELCKYHQGILGNPMIVRMAMTVTTKKVVTEALAELKRIDEVQESKELFLEDKI